MAYMERLQMLSTKIPQANTNQLTGLSPN
jgi:hypothetical protein